MTAPAAPAAPARVVSLDDDGIVLAGAEEVVLDVSFDGRRIWSFWMLRDSEPLTGPTPDDPDPARRAIGWPGSMQRFLDGTTHLTVAEHLSGRVLFDAETRFGVAAGRIAVVNAQGRPLGIDKSGRMAQTFDTRSPEQVAPLLDSIEQVLGALQAAGIEAFPAYGTLLGAVREGRLIGHDSDADLGYVSRFSDPVDVVRESFVIQRRLAEAGYRITRYSGSAFKVDVVEGDGSVRGLDVFGGFLTAPTGGTLYLMGEVGQPFERDWIFPLGTTTLEGRTLPAPAQPERLLAAMYGAGWKVPDPAFQFATSALTLRRLNGWFRGTRVHRDSWGRYYSTRRDTLPPDGPSSLTAYAVEQEGVPARVVDLGAGRCADALWFARQGASVLAYDFLPNASSAAQVVAAEEHLDLAVRRVNLLEHRSTLAEGARLAHDRGPRTILARHLADATLRLGRDNLFRLASMGLRDGGRLYLDVWTGGGERPMAQHPVPLATVAAGLRRHRLTIVHEEEFADPDEPERRIGRLVAEWQPSRARERPGREEVGA